MGIKKRIAAAVCVAAAFGGLVYAALTSRVFPGVIPENVLTAKPTITLWYTDEALGDFLAAMSLEYL